MKTDRVRELNDAFRANPHEEGGKLLITAGVLALGTDISSEALERVRTFDAFTQDNDPHGAHDFGSFELSGHKICWQISYFDKAADLDSPDASNPEVTTRCLSIFLVDEY